VVRPALPGHGFSNKPKRSRLDVFIGIRLTLSWRGNHTLRLRSQFF